MVSRFLIIVLLTLYQLNCGMCKKLGLQMYLTEETVDGLFRAVWNTNEFLEDETIRKGVIVPDQKGKYKLNVLGTCDWKMTNITIAGLQKPFSKVLFEDGTLRWTISKLTFDFTADWGINCYTNIIEWNEHKSGQLHLHICFDLEVKMAFDNGIRVGLVDCKIPHICEAEVDVNDKHNYPPLVQKLIDYVFADTITKTIVSRICPMLRQAMKEFEQRFTETCLSPGYRINMTVDHVKIGPRWAEVKLQGEVRNKGLDYFNDANPMEAPPLPTSPLKKHNKSQVMTTSYPISTMIYSAIRKGLYNKTIIPSQLPGNQAVYFATTCKDVCIGKLIPELNRKYPRSFVNVSVNPTSDVQVSILENGVKVCGVYSANISINGTVLFGFTFPINITVVPYHVDGTIEIKGNLTDIQNGTAELSTSVPIHVNHVPKDVMNSMRDAILEVHISKLIKDTLTQEMDLSLFLASTYSYPYCARVRMTNMELYIKEGYIAVLADTTLALDPCQD